MKNIFNISKCSIAMLLTLGILLGIAGIGVHATAVEEETTAVTEEAKVATEDNTASTEETLQELMPMMARGCGYTSVNQMQQLINSGQAPSTVTYVHNGFQGQQPHVHFSDGTAMNFDGTAHHGNPNPSASTMRWLNSHGWCI